MNNDEMNMEQEKFLTNHIEPKVARLESEIGSLARDLASLGETVHDLGQTVRHQGERTAQQIEQLLVAVTAASGPRKTDWNLIVSFVGIMMAIGAAIFTPINFRLNELKDSVEKSGQRVSRFESDFHNHERLTLHPVGASKVDALEKSMSVKSDESFRALADFERKLSTESQLLREIHDLKMEKQELLLREASGRTPPNLAERLAALELGIHSQVTKAKE